ncbi:helix-turn-helix transcriptional regulator [Corynebacterium tuberculostearicum]|uniref:helix-turn-helix transcriptional regulator n=1 Tax=Corynebacterium tuberculostearicum TaxID=38304 RepID=UPI0038D18FAE
MSQIELIGTADAAQLLGIGRATVHRWAESGRLNQVGELGKRGVRVFDRAEIEQLAKQEKKK